MICRPFNPHLLLSPLTPHWPQLTPHCGCTLRQFISIREWHPLLIAAQLHCEALVALVTNVAPAAAATADDATMQMMTTAMMITLWMCCGVSSEDAEIGRNEASSLSLFHISPSSSLSASLCLCLTLSFFLSPSLSLRANLG